MASRSAQRPVTSMVSTTKSFEIRASSAATSLRCSSQRPTRPSSSTSAPLADVGDHGHRGVDQRRVALVEHQQDVAVAGLVAAVGLDGVVQPQHGGRAPRWRMRRQASLAVGERREAVGRPLLGRRAGRGGAGGRPRITPEGALGADEDLVEVGPDGGPGRAAGVDHPAVGQGDVEADGHVLDLAVAVGELAGGAAGQPAADGRQGDRLRPVAEGDLVLGPQGVLEAVAEGAGLRRRGPSRSSRPSGCRTGRTGRGARRRGPGPSRRTRRCGPAAAVTGHRRPRGRRRGRPPPPRRSWAGHGRGPMPDLAGRAPRSWPAATSPGRLRPARRRRC